MILKDNSNLQDGSNISYPLILLAGTGCDERLFAALISEIKVQNSSIDVSVHCVGEYANLTDEINYWLTVLPEKFDLLGFSLGGIISLGIYFAEPKRVNKLILVDSTARADTLENAKKRDLSVKKIQEIGLESFILTDWPNQVAPLNANNESLQAVIVDMVIRTGYERLMNQLSLVRLRQDSLPRLSSIKIPVCVIAGKEDKVCHIEIQKEIVANVPNAKLHLIDGAGHFLPLEQHGLLACHVVDFLSH